MCVIFVNLVDRATEPMVRAAYEENSAGGGVAWRESGDLRWEKGLDQEEMVDRCSRLPLPFVAHFRIPSCGGVKDELCHPFPIDRTASLDLTGSTKGSVMFHNGHYHSWRSDLKSAVIGTRQKLPNGDWTDTRAMAFIAHLNGENMCQLFDEKIVVFGADHMNVYGSGWSKLTEPVIWVSNRMWESRVRKFDSNRSDSSSREISGGGSTVQYPTRAGTPTIRPSGGTTIEAGSPDKAGIEPGGDSTSQNPTNTTLTRLIGTGGRPTAAPFSRGEVRRLRAMEARMVRKGLISS